MTVNHPSINIHADVTRTKSVKINGRNILLKNGKTFDDLIVFSPGSNIIDIVLQDVFGKTKSYHYSLYYDAEAIGAPET